MRKEIKDLIETEQDFVQNVSKMIDEHISKVWDEESLFISKFDQGDDKDE